MSTKTLNFQIPEETHRAFKMEAVKQGKNIKDLATEIITAYCNNLKEYDDEPLNEEDIKDIKEAEKEYKEGKCQSLEDVMKELGDEDCCK